LREKKEFDYLLKFFWSRIDASFIKTTSLAAYFGHWLSSAFKEEAPTPCFFGSSAI
jgi:hypothetical protein